MFFYEVIFTLSFDKISIPYFPSLCNNYKKGSSFFGYPKFLFWTFMFIFYGLLY